MFQAITASRVVIEVGTHSAWVRDVVVSWSHEVLVANPRLMDGTKRRKRKNDRIDAHKLARLGRVDPQSLYLILHRSTEVSARLDDSSGTGRPGLRTNRANKHNTRIGEELGWTSTEVLEPEFPQ
jgi:transposase